MRGAAEGKKLAKIKKVQKNQLKTKNFKKRRSFPTILVFTHIFFHICHRFRVKSDRRTDRDLVNYSKIELIGHRSNGGVFRLWETLLWQNAVLYDPFIVRERFSILIAAHFLLFERNSAD